jgi:hypothetical protein
MSMTNEQFARWRSGNFRSGSAAARMLEMDRDTVAALETGRTRKGFDYPVPLHVALACAAWSMGLRDYRGPD